MPIGACLALSISIEIQDNDSSTAHHPPIVTSKYMHLKLDTIPQLPNQYKEWDKFGQHLDIATSLPCSDAHQNGIGICDESSNMHLQFWG